MANLFEQRDFELFSQFQGKTLSDAPEGQVPLRQLYDKLYQIIDGLSKKGYTCNINRNPLAQGGPGIMKYREYHWARIYPKELVEECLDKIFFVVSTTKDGIHIHIDSYASNGYYCNETSQRIKDNNCKDIYPEEAANYSCDDYVEMVISYIQAQWENFLRFGREFNIQKCITLLEIKKTTYLLKGNHNLILTGAPGTGKTYLAKEIAKAMNGVYKLVQFHPSYDYTDFVEGLRPIKNDQTLGFERRDGVFKEFCKEAIKYGQTDIDKAIKEFQLDLTQGKIRIKSHKSDIEFDVDLGANNYRIFTNSQNCPKDGYNCAFEAVRQYMLTGEYIEGHQTYQPSIGEYIKDTYMKSAFVFIIDEINRGEISKIFGELFYSIDPGYRGEKGKVNTQYQNLIEDGDIFKEGFYIPKNVYVIGTMNDIDRSVESMDFAMRRRFAWKEITAKSRQTMLDADDAWGDNGKPDQTIIDEIKIRMDNLNACIIDQYNAEGLSQKDKIGLTKAYQIGASYFLKYNLYGNFEELWDNHISGLLFEYLRGTTNIEDKIERLKVAYNDTQVH